MNDDETLIENYPFIEAINEALDKLVRIQNTAKRSGHANRDIVSARFFQAPADVVTAAVKVQTQSGGGSDV